MDLRASARRGVAWNSLAVSGTALVGLTQIAIAARFLDRGDFGLMAMILIVIGFSQNMADLGTANIDLKLVHLGFRTALDDRPGRRVGRRAPG